MGKTLRISDIQTDDILFFDPSYRQECYSFCEQRDIDCLPSLDDPSQVYVRRDQGKDFIAENIGPKRKIDGRQHAFRPEVLAAFRDNRLLFVYTDNELTGVVHFSDFNRQAVSVYLYEMLFQYERLLRTFLHRSGLNNDDMIAFFKANPSYGDLKRKYGGAGDVTKPPFEPFYLRQLIGLVNWTNEVKLNIEVNQVRNMTMHAHGFVDVDDWAKGDQIYQFEPFEKVFGQVLLLHADYRKVKNRISFMNER